MRAGIFLGPLQARLTHVAILLTQSFRTWDRAPGPLRRTLAMRFCQLTRREVEYLALSRDTTESDLKQRREIRNGTAYYEDQCAVAAAIKVVGRADACPAARWADRDCGVFITTSCRVACLSLRASRRPSGTCCPS